MPDEEEVAEATNMEPEEVREAIVASSAARPDSLDAPATRIVEEGAVPLVEQVGEADENLDQVEYNVMLEERLQALSERDREVLHLSFVEDLTQAEIGERVGVSQMQVSRIIRASLERLRGDE
jgi:RNA polymerase sigma-B factor